MELKSCSNPSGHNVKGLTDFSNSQLLDDTKSCLNENYFCSSSDFDIELEKCSKILGSESLVELKSCSSPPIQCSVEGLVQGTDFELLEDTKNNFCSSELDQEFEKCYEVLDLEQPVEMNKVEILNLKNDLKSLNKFSDLEENSNAVKSNTQSSNNLGLKRTKSSSSLDSDTLNADNSNNDFDVKNEKEILSSEDKILINETEYSSKESKFDASLNCNKTSNGTVNLLDSQTSNSENAHYDFGVKKKNGILAPDHKILIKETECPSEESKSEAFLNSSKTSNKIVNSLESQTFNAHVGNNDFDAKNISNISSCNEILKIKTECPSKESKSDASLNNSKTSNRTANSLDSQIFNEDVANNDFDGNSNMSNISSSNKILKIKTECPRNESKSDAFLDSKTSNKNVNFLDSQTFNADVVNNDFEGKNMSNISSCNKILRKKIESPSMESKPGAFLNNSITSNKTVNSLDSQTFKADVANNGFDGKNMSNISSSNKILRNKTECPSKKFKSDATLNDDKTSNKTVTLKREILNKDELKKREIKDYLEEEKDDLINPEWDAIKKLTTNEQRYQQVRKCWESRKIPDPNKNLTYHSYRKKWFSSRHPEPRIVTKQKRQASTQLSGKSAKRHCTFFLDKEIDSIERTMEKEKQAIINEMNDKISSIGYEDSRWNRAAFYDHKFNSRVSIIKNEYFKIADTCEDKFSDKISSLNERRNEVLQFYDFYKGLNDSNKDPTQLTESQFQELNEIEDVYRQFGIYYKD